MTTCSVLRPGSEETTISFQEIPVQVYRATTDTAHPLRNAPFLTGCTRDWRGFIISSQLCTHSPPPAPAKVKNPLAFHSTLQKSTLSTRSTFLALGSTTNLLIPLLIEGGGELFAGLCVIRHPSATAGFLPDTLWVRNL